MQKPGKVRFEYDPPSPIDIIADGSSVVVRDRKLATQDVYPLSQTPLRFLLADRIDLLRDTNVTARHVRRAVRHRRGRGEAGADRHQPADDDVRRQGLQLKQWIVTDPQGYDTTIAVSNLDSNRRPDPSPVQDRLHGLPARPLMRTGALTDIHSFISALCPRLSRASYRLGIARAHDTRVLDGATHDPACRLRDMRLTVTTWNINSVRLRIDLVAKFIKAVRPDVLCLQETKCPDDKFPLKRFKRLGYEHVALNGQKGYHGVVVVSRLPFESHSIAGLLRQDRLPARLGGARRARRPARSDHAA